MKTTNETTGNKSAAKIVAPRWWSVRPALWITLLTVMASAAVVLAYLNAPYALVYREGFRMPEVVLDAFQPTLTLLAVTSVIAVVLEGRRTGKLSLRRSQSQPQPQA